MKYWGEDQEYAVVEFNTNADMDEKHKVFVDVIEPAFRKLVENIYYTYNFNKILWDREQIEHEVMTHLYEKLSKFDVTKNKKSFSYFGTITKNWMIQRCNADKNKRFIDDDNQDIIVQNISIHAYEEDEVGRHNEEFINEYTYMLDGYGSVENGVLGNVPERQHDNSANGKELQEIYTECTYDMLKDRVGQQRGYQ